jgi:choline dehydrogenase-like flavoprotein
MTTKLKPVDVVIVGSGWTGGIIAKELAPTGLKVVMFERGRPQATAPDFSGPGAHDALKYSRRHEMVQNVKKETITSATTRRSEHCRCGSSAFSCRAPMSAVRARTGPA